MGDTISALVFRPPTPATPIKAKRYFWLQVSDQYRIPAFFIKRNNASVTILFSHGNAEDLGMMYHRMKELARLIGVNVMVYDYCGYGLSNGEPSQDNCFQCINAAYDYLRNTRKISPNRIVLYGRSLGSGPSCYLAAKTAREGQSVAGIILHSPFLSIFRVVVDLKLPMMGDLFENLFYAPRIKCPVLIIHGTKDDIVPFWHAPELLSKILPQYRAKPFYSEGMGHNNIESRDKEEYIRRLTEFLQKYIPAMKMKMAPDTKTHQSSSQSKVNQMNLKADDDHHDGCGYGATGVAEDTDLPTLPVTISEQERANPSHYSHPHARINPVWAQNWYKILEFAITSQKMTCTTDTKATTATTATGEDKVDNGDGGSSGRLQDAVDKKKKRPSSRNSDTHVLPLREQPPPQQKQRPPLQKQSSKKQLKSVQPTRRKLEDENNENDESFSLQPQLTTHRLQKKLSPTRVSSRVVNLVESMEEVEMFSNDNNANNNDDYDAKEVSSLRSTRGRQKIDSLNEFLKHQEHHHHRQQLQQHLQQHLQQQLKQRQQEAQQEQDYPYPFMDQCCHTSVTSKNGTTKSTKSGGAGACNILATLDEFEVFPRFHKVETRKTYDGSTISSKITTTTTKTTHSKRNNHKKQSQSSQHKRSSSLSPCPHIPLTVSVQESFQEFEVLPAVADVTSSSSSVTSTPTLPLLMDKNSFIIESRMDCEDRRR